jgi:hypothetical protein
LATLATARAFGEARGNFPDFESFVNKIIEFNSPKLNKIIQLFLNLDSWYNHINIYWSISETKMEK